MSTRARLLLIEGVPGLGKSTLLDRLFRRCVAESEDRRLRTLVHLTQAHTYGPLAPGEDAGTLTVRENIEHLERIVGGLEWLARTVAAEERTKCFVLVDCLHLTHCLRPGVVAWTDVEPFDRRLAAIGCKLLLLDGDAPVIRARTIETRAETQFIRDYALRCLVSHELELEAYFLRERDEFRRLFARSSMPKSLVAAETSLDELAASAYAFWVAGQ
jgi:thymidylate kinase